MSIGKTNSIGGSYQKKTITPYNFVKNVLPDANYNALSEVEIDGVLVDPHTPIESVQDNTTKYQKLIPNNVLTYGGLSKLGGLTKKYNQLINSLRGSFSDLGITVTTNSSTLTVSISGTSTGTFNTTLVLNSVISWQAGHKYLIIAPNKQNEVTLSISYGTVDYSKNIYTCPDSNAKVINLFIENNKTINTTFTIGLVDLTTIYGTGNEPTTVDQFLTDYPIFRGYVPYTTGTLDYAYTKKVDITGFNIWDEEWEVGSIGIDGLPITDATRIRSKNYIRVIPNIQYHQNYISGRSIQPYFYDKDKNFIDYGNFTSQTNPFTIPANAVYMKFIVASAYGTTYNHDICINVSNTTLNGTYKPSYHNTLLEAKIVAIKQKLVSLGYSADVLGYGLPNLYNYIDLENKQVVLNMGGVDLGTLDYSLISSPKQSIFRVELQQIPNIKPVSNNNQLANAINSIYTQLSYNAISPNDNMCFAISTESSNRLVFINQSYSSTTAFKQAMSGVMLCYELDTPVEIDVSDILDNDDIIGLLESGGTVIFENDDKYNLPSNVTYLVEVEE